MFSWLRQSDLCEAEARLAGRMARMHNAMHHKFAHLEASIMAIRDEFNQGLVELGSAVTELSSRIDQLPESVDDLTQEDLDAVRSLTGRVNQLAVAAPEVPTEQDGPVDETNEPS